MKKRLELLLEALCDGMGALGLSRELLAAISNIAPCPLHTRGVAERRTLHETDPGVNLLSSVLSENGVPPMKVLAR
jgi:hypothetical protein